MALPPDFLEEIRTRLSLAGVAGRHVKLIRRGREYVGLCPFHKEKTPSFNVVETKAFYHCFGCGAHGDVIGFTMRISNLGFREAVERLAREAGLRMPEESPRDRERAATVATLHDVCEAACVFFEHQLREPEGKVARDYLSRRGLDRETIARFRIGYAVDSRDALKRALLQTHPESLLIQAGLLRQREERSDTFDFFRGRVIFPISDRAGKVIAFGGRLLGDGQPKYLNSPDTPIFEKGRTLYALHIARTSALPELSPVVCEGYMDVIAAHRAGFTGAVAPLGTALTDAQLIELWKIGSEPILCFDGDAAGQRAAGRALERALPLVRPEFTLKFAILPEKEDPDSLIRSQGAMSFRRHLEAALPVSEFLWRIGTGGKGARDYSTPEKISRLKAKLEKQIDLVENRSVRKAYHDFIYDRIFDLRSHLRRSRELARESKLTLMSPAQSWVGEETRQRSLELVLLAIAINHPAVAREDIDSFAMIEITDRELRDVWEAVANSIGGESDMDRAELRCRLNERYGSVIDKLMSLDIVRHRSFTHFSSDPEWAMMGWKVTLNKSRLPKLERERDDAMERWVGDATEENWQTVELYRDLVTQHLTEQSFLDQRWGSALA